ncbi:hypothetical protein LTR28_006510, partial [Elasticomyces elasticus]
VFLLTTNIDSDRPAYTSDLWEVNGNVALPTLGQEYNSVVRSSITAGTAATGATGGSNAGPRSGSATASSHSAATSTAFASPGKEIAGMSAGLAAVMLGFIWWL